MVCSWLWPAAVAVCCWAALVGADRSCLQDSSFLTARLAADNLTNCLLKFSAPSRVCLKCGEAKANWDTAYNALSSTCQSYWTIDNTYNFLSSDTGIWNNANCGGCTQSQLMKFRHLTCTAESCLLQATPAYCIDILTSLPTFYTRTNASSTNHSGVHTSTNDTGPSKFCATCQAEIDAMASFYNSFSNACRRARDVVDQQQLAQDTLATLSCRGPEIPQLVFALSAAVCIVPPLLFYWLAFLCGRRSLSSSMMLLRTVDNELPDSPMRHAPDPDLLRGQQRTVQTRGIDFAPQGVQRPPSVSHSRHRRTASLDDAVDGDSFLHSIQ